MIQSILFKSLSAFAVLMTLPFLGLAQNTPIDFEEGGHGLDWTWTVFENGSNPSLEFIPNPDATGINTSSTVAKFTALPDGAPWVGCESMHGSDIGTFTIDEDNMIIRIMVWKSNISDVGIKLVRVDNWSLGEIKIANTLVNQWEQLTYDFSEHIGLTYDQIVVFPDFQDRNEERIIYFDNIMGEEAQPSSLNEYAHLNVSLSPNPTEDVLSIISEEEVQRLEIIDITGKTILDEVQSMSASALTQDVSDLPTGLYFIRVYTQKGIASRRFVKG